MKPRVQKYLKDLITKGLKDDVFPPQDVSGDIFSADFYWGNGTKLSPEATVAFRGHNGVYYLTYYWECRTVSNSVDLAKDNGRGEGMSCSILHGRGMPSPRRQLVPGFDQHTAKCKPSVDCTRCGKISTRGETIIWRSCLDSLTLTGRRPSTR